MKKRAKKPNTMRRFRLIAFLISVSSSLFTLSFGFANWYQVVLSPAQTVSGTVKAYGVLSIAAEQPKIFNHSISSFVDDAGAPCDTGTITIPCTIDVAASKSAFEQSEWAGASLVMNTTLGYKNLTNIDFETGTGLFSDLSITVKIVDTNKKIWLAETAATKSADGSKLVLTHAFPCAELPSEELIFDVIYTISLPNTAENPGNFRQNLGKYLSHQAPITEFTSSATLEKA